MAATTTPRTLLAGLLVARDVIELDGEPWRVVNGRTTKVLRTLELKHANYPNRTRTVRPRRDALVPVLHLRTDD